MGKGDILVAEGLKVSMSQDLTEKRDRVKVEDDATRYCSDNFEAWLRHLVGLHPDWDGASRSVTL